jgi:hypothetical protein
MKTNEKKRIKSKTKSQQHKRKKRFLPEKRHFENLLKKITFCVAA